MPPNDISNMGFIYENTLWGYKVSIREGSLKTLFYDTSFSMCFIWHLSRTYYITGFRSTLNTEEKDKTTPTLKEPSI